MDSFAAGIVLFIMIAQRPPFTKARMDDPYYKALVTRPESFWKAHCKGRPEGENFFSPDFKELVTKMLAKDPANRLTVKDCFDHKWMKGPVATQ